MSKQPRKIFWDVSVGSYRGRYLARQRAGAAAALRRDPRIQRQYARRHKGRPFFLRSDRPGGGYFGPEFERVSIVPSDRRDYRTTVDLTNLRPAWPPGLEAIYSH